MYSVHFDNLISTIWASTMFPWLITQKAAVPDYQHGFNHPNVPFRRDVANLRCQNVPYLYENSESTKPNQNDSYDDAEYYALSVADKLSALGVTIRPADNPFSGNPVIGGFRLRSGRTWATKFITSRKH